MLTKKASKTVKAIQPTLQHIGGKREVKLEKGVARRMDLGREEGYALAKQGFDGIIKRLKDREDSKKISTSNSGMQTNPTTVPAVSQAQLFIENRVGTHLLATAAVSIQTCSHNLLTFNISSHSN